MSEQSTTSTTLSPRLAEALAHFDDWKANGSNGSYAEHVASRMLKSNGEPITVGRAGVYVRDALAASGRSGEVGNGRGGGGGRKPRTAPTVDGALGAALAQFDQALARMSEREERAEKALSDFDAGTYIAERTAAMEAAVKQAQAALKGWKADEAEQQKAAEQERERLTTAADAVKAENAAEREKAEAGREQIAAIIEQATATS